MLIILNFSGLCFGFSGEVVNISDGDTITVLSDNNKLLTIRLYGIDSPEKAQAFGQKARKFTKKMVSEKIVLIEKVDKDRYGRTVGIVKINGTILNEELIKKGFAWQYEKYCKRPECNIWKTYEIEAKTKKIGLWVDKSPIPPWDFRRNKIKKKQQREQQRQQNKPTLSNKEIKKLIIKTSIASYPGNCPCPYNAASNGSRCGRRSAWSRGGGYSIICYENEVTDQMINDWRIKNR